MSNALSKQFLLECIANKTIIEGDQPIIHTLNKNVMVKDYFNKNKHLHTKQNIIVMGDLVDDIKMTEQLKNDQNEVLSIGFLNNTKGMSGEMLSDYTRNFDITILNDGNLYYLYYLLIKLNNKK